MTVATESNIATAIGNGVTTTFPYTFLIKEGEGEVRITTLATGAEGSPLVEGVDYDIFGEDDPDGGYVQYPLSGTLLSSDYAINIRRIVPYLQTLDLSTQSPYFPEQLEAQLDRLVCMAQQNAERISRAVVIGAGSDATPDELIAALLSASTDVSNAVIAAQAAQTGAETAQAAAEAAAGGMTPVETQIGAATDTDFLDADFLTARKTSNGTLIKRSWANVKALIWTALGGLIIGGTAKGTPVDADGFALADSAASNATKKVLFSAVKAAIFTALGPLIAATTAKTTPVNADGVLITDSAASGANKFLNFTNLKAFLKTYFDTLYLAVGSGGITLLTEQATTSGTTKDFVIPAGVKRITIGLNGVSLSGAGNIGVQLGDSGGIETSGYSGGGSSFIAATMATDASTASGVMTLMRMNGSHLWVAGGSFYIDSTSDTQAAGGCGSKTLSGELTTVRLMGGTFDAGSVNVMYE